MGLSGVLGDSSGSAESRFTGSRDAAPPRLRPAPAATPRNTAPWVSVCKAWVACTNNHSAAIATPIVTTAWSARCAAVSGPDRSPAADRPTRVASGPSPRGPRRKKARFGRRSAHSQHWHSSGSVLMAPPGRCVPTRTTAQTGSESFCRNSFLATVTAGPPAVRPSLLANSPIRLVTRSRTGLVDLCLARNCWLWPTNYRRRR
jgi:hypothetical protein